MQMTLFLMGESSKELKISMKMKDMKGLVFTQKMKIIDGPLLCENRWEQCQDFIFASKLLADGDLCHEL